MLPSPFTAALADLASTVTTADSSGRAGLECESSLSLPTCRPCGSTLGCRMPAFSCRLKFALL